MGAQKKVDGQVALVGDGAAKAIQKAFRKRFLQKEQGVEAVAGKKKPNKMKKKATVKKTQTHGEPIADRPLSLPAGQKCDNSSKAQKKVDGQVALVEDGAAMAIQQSFRRSFLQKEQGDEAAAGKKKPNKMKKKATVKKTQKHGEPIADKPLSPPAGQKCDNSSKAQKKVDGQVALVGDGAAKAIQKVFQRRVLQKEQGD